MLRGGIVRVLERALLLVGRRRCRPHLLITSQRAPLGRNVGAQTVVDMKIVFVLLVSPFPHPKPFQRVTQL